MKRPERLQEGWISYVSYKLRPELLVMPEPARFQLAAFLVEILDSPHDRVDVDVYCTVGFRADCDFFVRYIAPSPEELQEICVKVNNSGLGRYLNTVHNWMGAVRPPPGGLNPPEGGEEEVEDTPFMVVYPFGKSRAWYALTADERGKKMSAHGEIARKYKDVYSQPVASCGIGDQDWVMGFQVARLSDFEAMVREMRGTEASEYVMIDSPVLVGRKVPSYHALELCGAIPSEDD
jgi:chlorite dismutase